MQSISLYENKHSFLNGLTPGNKGLYIITALLVPAISNLLMVKVVFILVSIFLLIGSKVFRQSVPALCISGFIATTIFLVQGLFFIGNSSVLFEVGGVPFYLEGLTFGLHISLNILNIIFSVCTLILTTKPSDISDSLVKNGMSPRLGYVFASLFLLIPQMTERMSIITDAQRSRGMETEGNLFVRAKAFLPLLSPVIMSSFMDTKERTIALEVRGFNSRNKKSFLNEFQGNPANYFVRILLLLTLLGAIIWRILMWLS
ncbi:MAG: energy-coupling factor transporter transmembrane component T [Eubacteriales bacterium]